MTRLFRDVIEVYGSDDLRGFYEGNLEMIYLLEEAYISSRAREVFRCLEGL